MARKPRPEYPALTKEALLDWLREHPGTTDKREIARAFNVKGDNRAILREMLKELEKEGRIGRAQGRRQYASLEKLPEIGVIEISGIDPDGELMARPTAWADNAPLPRILVVPPRDGLPPLIDGNRVLAKIAPDPEGGYVANVIKRLDDAPAEMIGVFAIVRGQGRVQPTDRRAKSELFVKREKSGGAKPGDLVRAKILPRRGAGLPDGEVVERLGQFDDPGAVSLIAIHAQGIPTEFPQATLDLAAKAQPVPLGHRDDLRDIPLITIDGADARDFDDAVWAEEDPAPDNKGGFHLIVAIADVAHYVTPGDALDREAFKRGNSVYMPDRVVPMLPEKLSNDLCSLRPNEDRATMAVHMWIDKAGNLMRHRFVRGLIRSAARCTYEQVQRLKDGFPTIDDPKWPAAVDAMIVGPLYAAYAALNEARQRRGTLDLDVPERKVLLNEKREIEKIVPRERLDSHKLIEEFMIAANVAAAETLEKAGWPCMYRVHDVPDEAKVEALRDFLSSFDIQLARGEGLRSRHFADILKKVEGTPEARLISETMLRGQSQAIYSPENLGHFGLALRRYAHFTSPIRRYADLLVHRSLIGALKLGDGALERSSGAKFVEWGEHISQTERRAMLAERDAMDRYMALYMKDRVGARFAAHIAGVTRFGLFVALDETGAQGLVPIRSLGQDYFDHDEGRHCLTGRSTGEVFSLGDAASVTLVDADALTGSLLFRIEEHEPTRRAAPGAMPSRGPFRKGPKQDKRPPNKKFGKPSGPSRKSAGSRGKRGKTSGGKPGGSGKNGAGPKKFR
ncbi:MAG TPA: ribonuclease R [Alphaproteobacteria bacterium]|nr:ribonuclease R [Alphaproteobacteria bacterium]